MKNLLIYNPVSGVDKNRDNQLGKLVRELSVDNGELTIYQTKHKGDAVEYLCSVDVSRFDKVICCGGDGTLHEVVNGIMRANLQIPIGYIPQGTTNDYAKNLGISKENAIRCIKEAKTLSIDTGKFNNEYFNYVAAFGTFTNVSYAIPQKMKNMFGYCAYILGGIKSLANIVPQHIVCKIEDKIIEDDIVLGMITNAHSVAGISGVRQSATELDDGLMEYLFIKMPQNIMDLQSMIPLLLSGKMNERYIYGGKAKRVEISSKPMEWTLDGENAGYVTNAQICVLEKSLKMIVG